MRTRTRPRTTVLAAAGIAAALSLAAVTPALAGGDSARGTSAAGHARAAQDRGGDPRDVTSRVADFYGGYIDAVYDLEDPAAARAAEAARAFHLSAAAQKKVAAYEEKEHADGILFAQNVPVKWKVSADGTGAGHADTLVTLTWSDGPDPQVTQIAVRSDLTTRKITDLTPVE
ncbi:hypothetical protein [Streptomyces physcomitrii]|uniref:Secreted protein n=1 Tax=Streptomyces physcomitrii TaxID=2724184 RepID=A0ABX1H0J0_9ACTN|nr:hypothetical protein [Streptomyces physcomitrii]NKI41855.1 hypothetical protein [Streptomyces physcomitrii]